MSSNSLPARSVLEGLYEHSGVLAFYDVAEPAGLPTPIATAFPVIDTLPDELIASPGLAIEARACHLTLRVPDARAAGEVARRLAPYGGRLLLAPTWGGTAGQDRVGVVAGLAHASYMARLRRDLTRLDLDRLVVAPGTWVPAIVPDHYGTWRVLAHATRQAGQHVHVDLMTGADVVALLGRPVPPLGTAAVCPVRFRPSEALLDLYPRLYRATGGHVLVLGAEGKAIAAPTVHRLTPWGAVAAGHAYTAVLRADIAGLDLDSPTAIRAAIATQQELGLPPLVVWHSGTDGHLGGLTRVAPVSMGDLADVVHDTEAALCADAGLPRPDRMVARGGPGARMRPPASPSVKPGALVGTGLGVLTGVTADGDPVIEPISPDAVPALLGLGERPVVVPPAWTRGDTTAAERDPSDGELRRQGVSRSRAGIVPTTAADVITRWGLTGDPAMALTLPRTELLDRTATRIDASRWVGSLLWALLAKGATEDQCIAAVEAAEGLRDGYKGATPGTARFAARIRWEAGRVQAAIEDGRAAGHRTPLDAYGVCTAGVFAATADAWAAWPGGDPAELVTAAALLGMARDGRRLGRLGVGVRRLGATTGCVPETAAGRLRDLADAGRIVLVDEARYDPATGWHRADRYDLTPERGTAVPGRPPLEVVRGLLIARMCWIRGTTPAALLVMASATHHGTVTIDDLMAHWGLTRRQARAAAKRVAEVRTPTSTEGVLAKYDSSTGTLMWRADASLGDVARSTGAIRRYAAATNRAQQERERIGTTTPPAAVEKDAVAAAVVPIGAHPDISELAESEELATAA